MKRWEYLVLNFGRNSSADDDQQTLDAHGADGWELVSVLYSAATYAYLKRAKQPSSNNEAKKGE